MRVNSRRDTAGGGHFPHSTVAGRRAAVAHPHSRCANLQRIRATCLSWSSGSLPRSMASSGSSSSSTTTHPTRHLQSPRSLVAATAGCAAFDEFGRRGLSGACLEGALSSQAEFVAVMDADLQHDERLLSEMLSVLQLGKADLVIGSRYASGGAANGFSALRQSISRVATQWGRRLTGIAVHDPMSGFFMMRRDLLDQIAPELSSEGFKILFDILTTAGRRKPSIRRDPVRLSPAAQRKQQVRSAYRARVRRARSCEAYASDRPSALLQLPRRRRLGRGGAARSASAKG